jgi:hypothetical protein
MPRSVRLLGALALAGQAALVAVPAMAQMDPPYVREAFDAADTNGDGVIDEAEYAADAVSAFAGLDGNGDRILEPGEFDGTVDATLFDQIDGDGDGALSFDEVKAYKMDQFEEADRNGDAALSFDEALEFQAAGGG